MPNLFTLPKQVPLSSAGSLLPGSKLYFYQTSTTTPQNTYQNAALTTPHANPVIADASGVFAPIYLDGSLPDYRAKLTTSADVQIYQIDDIPSGASGGRTFRIESNSPEMIFDEQDAAANNGKWSIRVNSQAMTIDLLNDAESVRTNIMTLSRSGTTGTGANFALGQLLVNSESVVSAASTTFTATLTGCTTSPTATMNGTRLNSDTVILSMSTGGLTGTSNSAAMTVTGVPSGFRPKNTSPITSRQGFVLVTDNGIQKGAVATISSTGVITINLGFDGATAFTAAGTKGLPSTFTFIFLIA